MGVLRCGGGRGSSASLDGMAYSRAAALPALWARLCPGAAAAGHAAPQVCSPSGAESQGRW